MDLEGKASERSARVSETVGELASLQRTRSAGLRQLLTEQNAEMTGLERQRRAELATLDRERRAALDAIDRQIGTEASLFSKLAKHHNEAALLVAQKDLEPLHLATRAIEPVTPVPVHPGLKAAIAGLVGVLLGLTLAAGRELGSG
jgi:hypothetical protein